MQVIACCSVVALTLLISVVQCSLPYDPDNYLEVYPDPRNPEVLQGRTSLYFALILSLGGPDSQLDGSGAIAGVKVALDRINDDSSLLPGYVLHYTFTNSKVLKLWQGLGQIAIGESVLWIDGTKIVTFVQQLKTCSPQKLIFRM